MNTKRIQPLLLLALAFGMGGLQAQQAITIAGGDCRNAHGSISFSAGELAVQTSVARAITVFNITESFTEGVQQPLTGRDESQWQGITPLDITLSVYPNPTTDGVTLQGSQPTEPLTYILYAADGRTLVQGSYTGEQQTIDLKPYAAGNYLLRVAVPSNPSKSNVYKIIKSN